MTGRVEIVLVNDGSPDTSLDVALDLMREQPCIRVVDLSRNFGQHRAIMTGLAHATGEFVFLLDSDLEEPPELLEAFLDQMRRTSSDVVYGIQPSRKGDVGNDLHRSEAAPLYYRPSRLRPR